MDAERNAPAPGCTKDLLSARGRCIALRIHASYNDVIAGTGNTMMETGILCPFCNARIDGLAAGAKAVCPRCDAALPASIVAKLGGATGIPSQNAYHPSAP